MSNLAFRRRHPAFTLVELLVVIGIIALLISILLPTLSRARKQSQATVCLSNLHSYGNSMAMYIAENDGRLAFTTAAEYGVEQGGRTGFVLSDWYKKTFFDYSSSYRNVALGEGTWSTYGVSGDDVVWCPSLTDVGLNPPGGSGPYNSSDVVGRLRGFSGYGYNGGLASAAVGRIKGSAETAAIADFAFFHFGAYDASSSMLDVRSVSTNDLQLPTFQGRHSGRGAVLWLDGHAATESVVYLPEDLNTLPEAVATPQQLKDIFIGYLVRDEADIREGSAEVANYLLSTRKR